MSPIRRQAITRTNAHLLSIGPLGTHCSGIRIKIQNFLFKKMHLEISSVKWRPFCPEGDELKDVHKCTSSSGAMRLTWSVSVIFHRSVHTLKLDMLISSWQLLLQAMWMFTSQSDVYFRRNCVIYTYPWGSKSLELGLMWHTAAIKTSVKPLIWDAH